MAKDSNIVHQYYKKESGQTLYLLKVNPIQFTGAEIIIFPDGKTDFREFEFDEEFVAEIKAQGYSPAGPLEFNLYLSGLT